MSKRNRLDRIKAQKFEAENAVSSRASQKFLKKEPIALKILKLLMLVPFFYSGLFYGGVTVTGVYTGAMTVYEEGALTTGAASIMLVGILFMVLGIILAFFKKYIISFASCTLGTLLYLYVAYERVIKFAADRVTSEGQIDLDRKYMLWYYPILIFLFISLVMMIISIVLKIKARKRAKSERDNAPVKSIIED